MSFTNFTGGLVNTIAVGAGNRIATGLTNQLTSNISFSVGNVLAGSVQDASGYALDAGSNYLLSQVSSLVPPSVGNGLANAVTTQIASVGINAVRGFAQNTITNILGQQNPISGLAGSVTGASGNAFIGLHADGLPAAEYGGQLYTNKDIVFSVVPANPGPQMAEQPQTAPSWLTNAQYGIEAIESTPGMDALKGDLAFAGAARGVNIGGKNYGASYKADNPVTSYTTGSGATSILPYAW